MSKQQKKMIVCPACGKENEYIVWESLNADLDPQAKAQLLNGSLFMYECAHCGNKAQMCYPMLYHDMTHSAMVWLVEEASIEEAKGSFADFGELMGTYNCRTVTSPNALVEKALIFGAGLDDRVIEMIKFIFLADLRELNPEANITNVLFMDADGKYSLQFYGEQMFEVELPMALYEEVRDGFSEILDAETSEWQIGIEWALRVLTQDA